MCYNPEDVIDWLCEQEEDLSDTIAHLEKRNDSKPSGSARMLRNEARLIRDFLRFHAVCLLERIKEDND